MKYDHRKGAANNDVLLFKTSYCLSSSRKTIFPTEPRLIDHAFQTLQYIKFKYIWDRTKVFVPFPMR